MRDDERFTHDGLDLRVEQERLLALPVFNRPQHAIVRPELKVRRARRQPRRIGFARGGNLVNLTIGADTTLDRFDLQEALLHEDVHIYLQQVHPHERIGHDPRFWVVMDQAFHEAYDIDPATLPPRENRFAGRYAKVLRRAALVTNGETIIEDIDRALVEASLEGRLQDFLREHQLTSVEQVDPDTGEVQGRWLVDPRAGTTHDLPHPQPLEHRGATWADVEAAMDVGRSILLPNGRRTQAQTYTQFLNYQQRDDEGAYLTFVDPNQPRELSDRERAFVAGELDDEGYVRPAVIELPEPFKNLPEPERVPGGPAVITEPEYVSRLAGPTTLLGDPTPSRRWATAPRAHDRYGQPLNVGYRRVTRGGDNVSRRDRDILRALQRNGPMTSRELAAYLSITDGQARHATSRMRREGRIEKPRRGGPWQPVNWPSMDIYGRGLGS